MNDLIGPKDEMFKNIGLYVVVETLTDLGLSSESIKIIGIYDSEQRAYEQLRYGNNRFVKGPIGYHRSISIKEPKFDPIIPFSPFDSFNPFGNY